MQRAITRAKNYLQKSFVKYLIAGGGAAVAEYGSFALLYHASHRVAVANSVSYLFGLLTSFLLNRYWVFNHGQHRKVVSQMILYAILVCVNLGLINVVIIVLAYFGISPYIGKLAAMAVIVVWNFVVYNKVIFRRSA